MSGLTYRADVDGLRAVAVLGVVGFHAAGSALPGGYVGVDVFFVISGYLIAQIILADVAAGRFTIAGFYERRVRRILPALMAMLLICSPVFALYFAPVDFKAYAQSVAATLTFASNFYFNARSGYFDPGADARPLLHTWSLAVEEQYYLVFPLLVAMLHRRRGRVLVPVLAGLAVLSFAASVVQLRSDPSGTFYLPWTRCWELLVGALLATGVVRAPVAAPLREGLAIAGLAGILVPMALYSPLTPFPAEAALAPCLGAAALILAGPSTLANRLLALRPMVAVGKISYSLYLWHWPVLIGAQYLLMRHLQGLELLAYSVVILGLAWASWRWVEQPFRAGGRCYWPRPRLFAVAGGASVAVLALAVGVHLSQGLPGRFPEPARTYASAALDTNQRRSECDRPSPARIEKGDVCRLGAATGGAPQFALYGDSFADALAPGIDAAARRAHRDGVSLTYSACTPLPGVHQTVADCLPFNDAALAYIVDHPSIRQVVVVARWTSALLGNRFGAFAMDGWYIQDEQSHERGVEENGRVFERSLRRLLTALHDREVTVVAYIPEQRYDVPRALLLSSLLGYPAQPALPIAEHERRQAELRVVLARLQADLPFRLIDVGQLMCHDAQCDVMRDGKSLYADDNHLSSSGAIALSPAWLRAIEAPVPVALELPRGGVKATGSEPR